MVMAVYKQSFEGNDTIGNTHKVWFNVEEHDVYGSGRLGIRHGDNHGKYYQNWNATKNSSGEFLSASLTTSTGAYNKTHYNREIGTKQYELSNHLGNVLVTVTDKRMPYAANTSAATVDWYTADVVSYTDYYAFGAPETGRSGGDGYRYGFNGKENDDEVKGVKGSHQDYGMRMYDARVGRFFSSDPLMFDYAYLSTYQFAENSPISNIDIDGLEKGPINKNTGEVYACPQGGSSTYSEDGVVTWHSEKKDGIYVWVEGAAPAQQGQKVGVAGRTGAKASGSAAVVKSTPASSAKSGGEPKEPLVSMQSKTVNSISQPKVEASIMAMATADGLFADPIERNVDFSAIRYKPIEYNGPQWYSGGIFYANVAGGVYNNLVVGTLDLIRNPGAVITEGWNSTSSLAIHQASCIYSGTVLDDLGEIFSDPHQYENFASSCISTWAGGKMTAVAGKYFPILARGRGILGSKIWSSTKKLSGVENALAHFKKHGVEFPEFCNAKQYVEGTHEFLHNSPKGTLTKVRPNGDILKYHPGSNTFGVMNSKGIPKTMFRPTDGIRYWLNQ